MKEGRVDGQDIQEKEAGMRACATVIRTESRDQIKRLAKLEDTLTLRET